MLYLISTQTLTSSASTISFTSIPATYDHLVIKGSLRGDNASTGATVAIRVNNDSGSNYSYRTVLQYNTTNIYSPYSATSDSFMYIGNCAGGNAGTNMWGPLDAMIGDYRGSLFKSVFATTGNMLATNDVNKQTTIAGNLWKSTSAINQVDVIHASSGSWIAGSTVSLYGLAL